jgi:tagaturonate reductase
MVPVAYLRGLRTVRESIEDAYTGNFIRKALFEEIIPTLDLTKEELNEFANDVLERFQNPSIKHELISIALNSISKFKVRVLPTILEYEQRTHKLPERLLQALAALIVFYKGNWRGEVIPLNDSPDVLVFLKDVWQTNSVEVVVQKVLSHESFWDCDLTQINGLQELVTRQVKDLNSSQ